MIQRPIQEQDSLHGSGKTLGTYVGLIHSNRRQNVSCK